MVGAVPEDPAEVVGVGGGVPPDLLTEASVFGGGDHLQETENTGECVRWAEPCWKEAH